MKKANVNEVSCDFIHCTSMAWDRLSPRNHNQSLLFKGLFSFH